MEEGSKQKTEGGQVRKEKKRFRGKRERAKKTDGLLDRTGGRRGIIERARKRDTT